MKEGFLTDGTVTGLTRTLKEKEQYATGMRKMLIYAHRSS